jgi:hypothetical protein
VEGGWWWDWSDMIEWIEEEISSSISSWILIAGPLSSKEPEPGLEADRNANEV